MSELQNDIEDEVKKTKQKIYREEIGSFLAATVFAANLCCAVMYPVTIITILNTFVAYKAIKYFKPTVKTQYYLHKHLKFLTTVQDDKIWTSNDS